MKVIALTGRAGSGKDTAAGILQFLTCEGVTRKPFDLEEFVPFYTKQPFHFNEGNGTFHVFKFAWPVYKMVGILLHRNPDDLMRDKSFKNTVQKWGLTGRQLLQKVGTECFRDVIGSDVWCDVMEPNLQQDIPGAIISDLRFVNEAEFLKTKHDAVIIKLVGRNNGTSTDHPSEAQIDSIKHTYTVANDGNYKDLAMQLEIICFSLKILNAKYTWK